MANGDRKLQAAIAVTRFGLGARPGEIAKAESDPQGFLHGQIRKAGADRPATDGETTVQRIAALRDYRQDQQQARRQKADAEAGDAEPAGRDPVQMARRMLRDDLGGDFLARAQLGATTDAGFRERWTLFWANHFTVSAIKLQTATVAGPFEVEAIRPHVFGRFEDLLTAAETHPAMLMYLDQAQSVGPNSRLAQRAGRGGRRQAGLNENLAREILELHTVGVDGGYTQADVTEFARAMTGLSVGGPREPDRAGQPVFRAIAHEPGPRTVLGVRYAEGGGEQAQAILADLARRPETARFVCRKLARHFVADDPPASLVDRLAKAWTASDADLAQVAEALVTAPEAWTPQAAKFKTPYEFVVSSYRAAGTAPQALGQLAPVLTGLGQRPFGAPSPKGWPEDAEAWAAPDALIKRMQFAQGFAETAARSRDPKALAADALGARLGQATATAVARAESRPEGFAILLMSPEFQRR